MTLDDPVTASLLHFLAPGFVHGIGNDLFQIQARAQLLGTADRDVQADRQDLLAACQGAGSSLSILRLLLADGVADDAVRSAGPLLSELCAMMRIRLQGCGLTVVADDAVFSFPARVVERSFARAVALAGHGIARALPTGFRGTLRIDVEPPNALRLQVVLDAEYLPFAVDLLPVADAVREAISSTCWSVRTLAPDEGRGLLLTLADSPDDFPDDTRTGVRTEIRTENRGEIRTNSP